MSGHSIAARLRYLIPAALIIPNFSLPSTVLLTQSDIVVSVLFVVCSKTTVSNTSVKASKDPCPAW